MVTTHLGPDNMVGYPDHYVQAEDKRGMGKGRIAVDMDAYY